VSIGSGPCEFLETPRVQRWHGCVALLQRSPFNSPIGHVDGHPAWEDYVQLISGGRNHGDRFRPHNASRDRGTRKFVAYKWG